MNLILSFIKRIALNWLPRNALQFSKKIHYARKLKSFSLEDEPDIKIVQSLVKPGDYVVDIGANFGIYTKVLSQLVGGSGCVYSIEPVPTTYEILCSNLKKLRLGNVKAMNCAVSNSNATLAMVIPPYLSGGENFYRAHIVRSLTSQTENRVIYAQGVTFDKKFHDVSSKISFIKCDVEGHELECLRGAKNFLAKTRAAWLIEIAGNPDSPHSSAQQVFNTLLGEGYNPWWFDKKVLRKRRYGEESTNYFFLKDDHVNSLKSSDPKLFLDFQSRA